jgi:hypothetical protein
VTLRDRGRKARANSKADQSTRSQNPRRRDNQGPNKAYNHPSARKNHTRHNQSNLPFPLLEARAKIRRKASINQSASIATKKKWQMRSGPNINMALRGATEPYPAQTRDRETKRV